MFTGDATYKLLEMLSQKPNLKSDILKAGHHGSHTSSSEDFVKAISPKIAIISAGKNNRYGHPHKETIDLFNSLGILHPNTADVGTIECVSDGWSFTCDK